MNNDLVYRKDVEQMLASIGGCDATEEYERGFDDAIDVALSELREVKSVDRWIPCSERLPKNNYDTVLVFLDSKIYDIAIWHSEYGFRPWYAGFFNESPPEWDACVTAWQPLPEPWEGEK